MRYVVIVLLLAAVAFAFGVFHRDGEKPASWWALVLLYYDIRKLILLLRSNRQARNVESPKQKEET